MHMVTETYQLRDGDKLTEFYNGIDWKPLFEFVRRYYGVGVEQLPTTCLKPNGRIEVNWPENLRDKCGLFGHTYREVYLQTFSSCCFHDITYDEVLKRGLKVMDLTATCMCKENNLPIIVFDMDTVGNLKKVMQGEEIGTLVHN